MSTNNLTASTLASTPTSLRDKMLNILVSPGEVFEEVIVLPPRVTHWFVPTLLVCLSGIMLLRVVATEEQSATLVTQWVGTASAAQAERFPRVWPMVASLVICLSVVGGTLWSAFVLWFIGRVFLKTRFSLLKTVEVVGLIGIIVALGNLVTLLLISVFDDAAARPALSLFAIKSGVNESVRAGLDAMNLFHLWTTTILAVALSKLGGVSFKESAVWVFGFWVLARIALIVLT